MTISGARKKFRKLTGRTTFNNHINTVGTFMAKAKKIEIGPGTRLEKQENLKKLINKLTIKSKSKLLSKFPGMQTQYNTALIKANYFLKQYTNANKKIRKQELTKAKKFKKLMNVTKNLAEIDKQAWLRNALPTAPKHIHTKSKTRRA